jgi:hypothetical protein
VLRPRFTKVARSHYGICVGNQVPDLELLKTVLSFGADPNQTYQHISIWALFLGFLADHLRENMSDGTSVEELTYLEAVRILLERGVDVLLPRHWPAEAAFVEQYRGNIGVDETPDERFSRRFANVSPITTRSSTRKGTLRSQQSSRMLTVLFWVIVGQATGHTVTARSPQFAQRSLRRGSRLDNGNHGLKILDCLRWPAEVLY